MTLLSFFLPHRKIIDVEYDADELIVELYVAPLDCPLPNVPAFREHNAVLAVRGGWRGKIIDACRDCDLKELFKCREADR